MAEREAKKPKLSDETASENHNATTTTTTTETNPPQDIEDDDDDESQVEKINFSDMSRNCPYLDTVKRYMLDFDFEKICSTSLSNHNVYACLICGKYFQGRGKNSYAYLHSIHEGHHVFINLKTLKVYCLPDNYEVIDRSLDDIKFVLRPTFTKEEIDSLDNSPKPSYDLNGKSYLAGYIGLNNIRANDYVNVVVQALSHIAPFRNFFMNPKNYAHCNSSLVASFGELVRKMWNPRAFKGQVSPHELIQAISNSSNKAFKPGVQSDPAEFLSWFLNKMHTDLGGTKKKNSSIVYQTFQGNVEVTTEPLLVDDVEETVKEPVQATTMETPYLFLSLELPPPPLFKSELEKNIIPQIPLNTLLQKFQGFINVPDARKKVQRRYQVLSLPNYLVLLIKRFSRNNWDLEKNPTIVNFPIKNQDFADCLKDKSEDLQMHYDLVANIIHEGKPGAGNGVYKAQVRCKGSDQWFEIQDLFVDEKTPQMIFLSESYIQFWERKKQ